MKPNVKNRYLKIVGSFTVIILASTSLFAQGELDWMSISFPTPDSTIHVSEAHKLDSVKSNGLSLFRTNSKRGFCFCNRTDTSLEVSTIEGSLDSIWTEVLMNNNTWVGLQHINYQGIWCGNSYYKEALDADSCLMFNVWLPYFKTGQMSDVRVVLQVEGIVYHSDSKRVLLSDNTFKRLNKTQQE